jgi:hypothetical protein
MENSSARQNAIVKATVFGIIPCIFGVGFGQYLRWRGTIWLTDAGGFWPIVCFGASLAAFIKLANTPLGGTRTTQVGAWLIITWTWLYFPFWLTAIDIPQSSAVISKDARVFIASDWARDHANKVWLLTGRAGNKIVRNVEGTVTVNAVEVRYRFAEPYIATRSDEEDISKPIIGAADAALAVESRKSRSSRIALFEKREVHDRLLADICRAVVKGDIACPLKLTLSPQSAATVLGGVWSKYYSEQEAITEKHLPTLVNLLTQDKSRLVERDLVYGLFMELADNVGELSKVARKSRMLNEHQFDELIRRILVAPEGGDEALSILQVNRLNPEQRQALRDKAFREANIALIVKQVMPLRISDAEIPQLAVRMRSAFETNPDVAVSVLEIFGERLPRETQHDAVSAIVKARASYAFAALRHLNFSRSLREMLLQKVVADANFDDLDAAYLSREKLEDILTPAELRPFIASVIKKSESSKEWLTFAVRVLPVHAMTIDERRTLVSELMFSSTKSALEFVSENRQHLEVGDVSEVTYDYIHTITRDMCLHLTHRNANRQVDYFSETQLQIFRECAQTK